MFSCCLKLKGKTASRLSFSITLTTRTGPPDSIQKSAKCTWTDLWASTKYFYFTPVLDPSLCVSVCKCVLVCFLSQEIWETWLELNTSTSHGKDNTSQSRHSRSIAKPSALIPPLVLEWARLTSWMWPYPELIGDIRLVYPDAFILMLHTCTCKYRWTSGCWSSVFRFRVHSGMTITGTCCRWPAENRSESALLRLQYWNNIYLIFLQHWIKTMNAAVLVEGSAHLTFHNVNSCSLRSVDPMLLC